MRVAIDASRAAETQKTGVGWYCHHLLRHLKDVIPDDVGVVLYSDRPLPKELHPWPEQWEEKVLRWPPTPSHSPSHLEGEKVGERSWPMWSQVRLVAQVLRDRPDVLFVPAHVIPFTLALAPQGKRPRLVTTIHDVVFKQFPDSYSTRERWYADHATRLAVRRAERIIVPTEAVRWDLERYYGCASERVTVIHHGVTPLVISTEANEVSGVEKSHKFVPRGQRAGSLPPSHEATEGRGAAARDDEGRFVLYVGRLERKKNVARMVEAFSRIAPQHPDLRLVLAGPPGFGYEEVRAAIDRSPVRDRIVETGWVDQAQYHQFLSSASVFLFPTLGEGFGLPILEAMAAGVPVITSRGGAHEEVAGDAALLVDPESTDEIAAAIDRTLRDANLRVDFVRRGRQRVTQFTWTRSAQDTWNVLRDVLFT